MNRRIIYGVSFVILLISAVVYQLRDNPAAEKRMSAHQEYLMTQQIKAASINIETVEDVLGVVETTLGQRFGDEFVENMKPFTVSLADGVWLVDGQKLDGQYLHLKVPQRAAQLSYIWKSDRWNN